MKIIERHRKSVGNLHGSQRNHGGFLSQIGTFCNKSSLNFPVSFEAKAFPRHNLIKL